MNEGKQVVTARRLAAIAAGRLRRSGAMLGAGAAVAVVIHLVSGGPWLLLAGGLLLLVAVALLRPARGARPRPEGAVAAVPVQAPGGLSAESLAAAIADPLVLADDRGAVVMANRAAVAAFGELRPGLSLLLKFRAPEMQALLEAMLSGGEDGRSTDHFERLPIERVYRVNAVKVGRGTGMFVLLFKDQSETLRIDRMRADFIANASHELRTPLAAISGFVETLRGPARNDAAARDRFLQIMQEQTARMARLIEDLLSLSRLEMKALAAGDRKVDLASVVESVTETLKPLAAESGVTIENLFGGAPAEVRGDRDELFQVFQNLVENACKYGRSGGRVEISRVAGGAAEIGVEVRDYGPGIPAQHIPRITERFYRIDAETSRLQKGTGLGLSIVKHIVSRHKGRLAIASELGKGAAFTVHLPTG